VSFIPGSDSNRSLKNAFRSEKLLIARRGDRLDWFTNNQVFLKCPTFALFTPQLLESKSPYFTWLCNELALPAWSHETNLEMELERGVAEMKTATENWELIQQYVFKALESIFPMLPESANPSWIRSILQLTIFPVTTPDGSRAIQRLSENIFVPDSELLNAHFSGKVDILDFGKNHIWDILPVLRCSAARLKYLSDYNRSEEMEIRVVPPQEENTPLNEIIQGKKIALTRYSHPLFGC
jgi:hypothetical protein